MSFLKKIQDNQKKYNDTIEDKLKNGQFLTDDEALNYKLTEDDLEVMKIFSNVADGQHVDGFAIKDFLASPQAKVLIPKVLIGTAKKAMDPVYLASNFFKKIRLKNGSAIQFPTFGVMRAYDVAESAEIPAENIDWNLSENSQINVGKVGIRIQYTDEIIEETEFDIVSMLTSEAARSLARHKEQKAFTEWKKHSWKVFDNALYAKDPVAYKEARTTGVDFDNVFNGTLSLEDYLDLVIACYNNGYTPTDTIMHSLAFPAFIKNGLTGALTAVNEQHAKFESPNKKFTMGPEAMQGKLPFGLTVSLSPFANINKRTKCFDLTVCDRNNVGYLVQKMDIKTENFRDPSRDLNNVKFVEKYGFGTKDEGRAVCTAQNIAMSKSYPHPQRVQVMPSKNPDANK